MKRLGIISVFLSTMIFPAVANAEYMNQRNIIASCAADNSFGSECFTYLSAYKDLMVFLIRATDDEKSRLYCLDSIPTEKIAKRLSISEQTATGYQIPLLIIEELCN